MRRRLAILLVATLALPVAAAAVFALEPGAPAAPSPLPDLVGGLGPGLAVDLARCGRAFDPRVAPVCAWRHEPLPGADFACPLHGDGR